MPAAILSILGPVGKVLLNMFVATWSRDIIKSVVIHTLSIAVQKYKRRAEKTAQLDDDECAKAFEDVLQQLKDKWENV